MMEKEQPKQQQQHVNRPRLLYRRGDFETYDNSNYNSPCTDSTIINGRHLVANDNIEKGQIVFVERPMVCIQSLENLAIHNVKICRHCKSFLDITTITTTSTTTTRTAIDNNSITGEYALQSFCQTTTIFDDSDNDNDIDDDNQSHQLEQQQDNSGDDVNNDESNKNNSNNIESATINEIEKLRRKFLQTMTADNNAATRTTNKLQSNYTNDYDNDYNNLCRNTIISCRYNCGYMYCSIECEQDSWESYHWCLCTGLVSDSDDNDAYIDIDNPTTKIPVEEHPLIKFKQYAVQTNEILLLVAEWWVAEYMYKQYYNNESNVTTTVLNDKEQQTQQQLLSPYQDYLMNTWWDAVALDMKSQQLVNTNNNTNTDNWIVERNNSTNTNSNNTIINQTIDDIEESIHRICYDGATLLNDALAVMSNNTIPSINAYDVSIRIGSCEQNSMGIRQRHPLCKTIIVQQQLRQQYHKHFSNFLYSNGILEINSNITTTTTTTSNHHDNNNDDNSDTMQLPQNEDDDTDQINENNQTDGSTADIDSNGNHNSNTCIVAAATAADDDNKNKNCSTKTPALHEQYTVDDIANELSKLDFLEWNHLRNIANELRDDKISYDNDNDNDNKNSTTTGSTTSTKVVSQHGNDNNVHDEKKYDDNANDNSEQHSTDDGNDDDNDNDNEDPGDGDDYDYLFPPIDGTAMYSNACKMNHSCVPNVIILYNPRIGWSKYHPLVAIAVALQPICTNDEMTISYIDLNQSYEQRQAALANYGFICTCSRCIQEKTELDSKCTSIDNQQHTSKDETQDQIQSDIDDDENEDENENDPSNGYKQNIAGDDGENDVDESIDVDDQYIKEHEQHNRNGHHSVSSAQESNNSGEERLQQLIDTADTKWNQSMYGTIPANVMCPISSFIVQCGTATLANLQQLLLLRQSNNSNLDTPNQITIIIKFLQRCIDAIEHRDYSMCKIVGTDLSQILLNTVQTNQYCWNDTSYRYAYWCSTIVAAIGYSKDWNFLVAMQYIDQSIITGVPIDDDSDSGNKQLIQPLLYYIEQFADQMYTVPYPPSFRCTVPEYSIAMSLDVLTLGLSQPILYPTIEVTSNEIPLDSSVYSVLSPIVIRNFAISWSATTKWRHLHTLAHTFGHRLLPIEIGSKMTTTTALSSNNVNEATTTTTTKIVSFRSFIEQYFVPSTNHGIWTLQDAVEKSKRLKYKESTVSYLSQQHTLRSQISILQNDIVMILPALFTTTGTSPTTGGSTCTNNDDQQQQPSHQQHDTTSIPKHVSISMGTGGTRTPLHSDSSDIVFVQIVGVQYVRMYTPDQASKLYFDTVKNDNNSSTTTISSSLESSLTTSYQYHQLQGTTIVSNINCEIENYKEQPLCENAICYTETILYPGDCLYVPSQTLYYVRSLTTSISINYWL